MKILFSKPDSLGDQFIAAGSVQALRRLRPEARLVWHVRAGYEVFASCLGAEVFAPNLAASALSEAGRLEAITAPLVVLPFPLSPYDPWTNETRTRVAWWAAFLRATKWDAAILGLVNRNWVGDLTVSVAPAAQRIGFAANVARQPLMNEAGAEAGADAPVLTTTLPPSFSRSESAQMRDLLAVLEPALPPAPLWQPVTEWQPRLAGAQRRALIAPGVGGDARRAWGATKLSAVAAALRTDGFDVSWLEGPGDAPYFSGLPTESRLTFTAEQLPLLIESMRQADVFLCHDTAYVHIAAGLRVPTLAIFGAGQHGRFHPAGSRVKVIQTQMACGGCQWHCLWDRLVCVADLPVEPVVAAMRGMISGDDSLTTVPLASPVAHAAEGEAEAVRRRLQEQILMLDADRFARLQIIQSLLAFQQSPPAPRS